jgi:serine/threonine protein kinase
MGACLVCSIVDDNYTIQYKREGVFKPTGAGAFAEVRACTDNKTGALRAIKTIDKEDLTTRSKVYNEVYLLRLVKGGHPNIVAFYDIYEEWSMMHLITEYCSHGTLEEAIQNGRASTYAAQFMHQLIGAINFLEGTSIIHRDVKIENCLLSEPSTLKLCDFGSAKELYKGEMLLECEGTPMNYAPEMFMLPRGKGYSFPVDVWAAGVVMFFILVSEHPFMSGDGENLEKNRLKRAEYSVGWLTSLSASSLIEWLLMPSPQQRISAANALRHPWFASYSLGPGDFREKIPYPKLIGDSHGNWFPGA